jgi:DNA polymerase
VKTLAQSLDSATRQALQERVRFYRDLGLTEFYRRPVDPALLAKLAAEPEYAPQTLPLPESQLESQEEQPIPPRKPFPVVPAISPAVPAAERAAAMQVIREELGECTRCALHTGRNKLVFGDGPPTARLMFVGEGPGADEDAQGLPFVGKAGQLLNNMIAAMGLKREEVYIANVVKCRPPNNRVPEPEEGATCSPFLFRQIDVVRPELLVALGATAATWLLGTRQPLAGLRGRVHTMRGTRLVVTYHPAYLLRDPRQKKEAWADLQIVMKELGLKLSAKG